MCGFSNFGQFHGPFGAAMVIIDIGGSRNDLGIKNLNLVDDVSGVLHLVS